LGNFWSTYLPVKSTGQKKVVEQYTLLKRWNLEAEDISTEIWLPDGFISETDPSFVKPFNFDTSEFDCQDWADIFGLNIMSEPQGQLLSEVYDKVKYLGWDSESRHYSTPRTIQA